MLCNNCGEKLKEEVIPATGSLGLEYVINSDNATCTIVGMGTCKDKEIYINDYIDGYKVTSIGEKAFSECASIEFIKIPTTVTTLGTRAFYGCTGLTEITIPFSVESIGTQIFYKAENLHTVYYNGSYGSQDNDFMNLAHIQKIVFDGNAIPAYILYGCSNVIEVEINSSVKSIGREAFYNCTSLASITIPNTVTSIDYYAFSGCELLTDVYYTGDVADWLRTSSYNWNSTPMDYAANLYIDGELVTNIVVPNSVTSIGKGAFAGCTSLVSITIPDSVTSIGKSAFSGCTSLISITIPDSVTSIGNYAFYGCTSLASIKFPDSVTSIGENAFSSCTLLTSVIIPDSVTSIGFTAFYSCTSLKIYCESDMQPSGWNSHWNWLGTTNYIPVVWGCSEYKNAFYQRSDGNAYHTLVGIKDKSITTVDLHAETKVIGENVFYNCTSLTSITIPDFVTNIGKKAFYKCTSLASITIPNSVTSIGYSAFYGCTSLTSVTIPDSVTTIDSYAFENCPLRIITFEGTVEQWKAIGKYYGWNNYTKTYTIYCTDGTISKDGTVTYN